MTLYSGLYFWGKWLYSERLVLTVNAVHIAHSSYFSMK